MSVFLLLFISGYGGYSIHQAAKESKNDYQEQVADYFWLRAQAGNIDSNALSTGNTANGEADMPPANRISALLNTTGITDAQVVAAGDSVQLSFIHPSQAVVSTALGKLEQLFQSWWQLLPHYTCTTAPHRLPSVVLKPITQPSLLPVNTVITVSRLI